VRRCFASSGVRFGSALPGRRGDGRRNCAAAACSRRVEAPLKGLVWSGRTTAKAVMDGKGPCFWARRFVLEDSLGESLATATPVGAALPVGGVVYPL